jgi:hypothetical protein
MYAVGPRYPARPAGEPDDRRPGGHSVETVNAMLHHLQAACDGCLVLTRPYAGEPRVIVTVVGCEALKRAAGSVTERSPTRATVR